MSFIKINNIKIFYSISGSGEPLVFIHAAFYDSSGYNGLISILGKKFKIYSLDLPMCGKSGSPAEYLSMVDIASIIGKFIKKLGIRNPSILAHSIGAVIAIRCASQNQAKKLFLIDPAGLKYFNFPIIFYFKALFKTLYSFFWNPLNAITLNFKGIYNILRNIFNSNFWRLVKEELSNDYIKEMKKIKCPTIIFWGKYDEVISYKYSAIFKQNIKNSEVIIVKGNHDWPVLQPNEITKYLNKF